ncbi:ent-kaurene synthase 1, chloroplastic-like [Bidens hawaiensis]|uniref:ent-kaurene synthase 1, chloroplastic-like n=1 Tax=Bidens hawaiensis TaxID=980011 RepID=UPI00404A8891
MGYCYFSASSVFSSPELSDARIAFSKASFLVVVLDDFFDVEGSVDELVNIIQCVEKWNVNVDTDCCSKEVRILFLAIKDVVSWIGDTAYKWQERDITRHVIQCWLEMLYSMLTEAKWNRDNVVPTMNEYLENGYVSFTLGTIVLPSLYFIGPKLSEVIVQSSEYHNLYEVMSTHGRLLNDIRSYKRELKDGKLNVVTLHKNYGKSGITEEEIVVEIKTWIDNLEKKLMQLVLETKESSVPKACKDVFWKTNLANAFFYATDDGFTGNNLLDTVEEVMYEPVSMLMKLSE